MADRGYSAQPLFQYLLLTRRGHLLVSGVFLLLKTPPDKVRLMSARSMSVALGPSHQQAPCASLMDVPECPAQPASLTEEPR